MQKRVTKDLEELDALKYMPDSTSTDDQSCLVMRSSNDQLIADEENIDDEIPETKSEHALSGAAKSSEQGSLY